MHNDNKSLNTNSTRLFLLHETVSTSSFTNRGFTGHEHLDAFGLIDMNGRVYDPVLGRFLSPDKFVQAPFLTQSFNRYSYCLNNPLKYTDPSGDFWNWPIVWAGNFLIGGMDRWINQKQPFKQAFSPANYPVVFSTNFSPGNTTKQNYFGFSNAQSEAQKIAGSKTAYKIVSAEIESARSQKRNATNGGDGGFVKTAQTIALASNVADIAISTAEQTIQTTRAGANFAYAISGSSKLVNVVSNSINYAPYVGLGVTILTGSYLSTENNPATGRPYQSWTETGIDIGVNIATIYIGAKYGGWYGAGSAAFYIGVKTNVQFQMNNGINPGFIFIVNRD